MKIFGVTAIDLFGDKNQLSSTWTKLFSNYDAAKKYTDFCFESGEYSNIEKYISDQNGNFTITTFQGVREEFPGLKNTLIIQILEEEPSSVFSKN